MLNDYIFFSCLYLYIYIMEFKNSKDSQVIANYLGRIICKTHTKAKFHNCYKGCGMICRLCNNQSQHLQYQYQCTLCQSFNFCIIHYIRHIAIRNCEITNSIPCTTTSITLCSESISQHGIFNAILNSESTK